MLHIARTSGKFTWLFYALLVALFLLPFVQGSLVTEEIFYGLFSVIVLAGLYTLSEHDKHFKILASFGAATIICNLIALFTPYVFFDNLSLIFNLIFLLYIMALTFKSVFFSEGINTNALMGAVCIYMLMGFIGGLVCALFEAFSPGSFHIPNGVKVLSQIDGLIKNFFYYSFSTLIRLECKITAVSEEARYFTVVQVMTGQLYLTILVARLIKSSTSK